MDPHEITPGTTDSSLGVDPSNVPLGVASSSEPAPGTAPESTEGPEAKSSLIDPAIPRLGTPVGAGRFIPADRTNAPSFLFLVVVSVVTLASDLGTKFWAEKNLDSMPSRFELWKDHIGFVLAQNRGGAWGLLQSTNENVRRPFFLLVSAAAIAFIVTLYRRLLPTQRALKWGLPLVLGGALGNVFDRIRYGHVIDFIDVHMLYKDKDHHWPTFNVADIAICVGVGLMAIDMFTAKRPRRVAPLVPVDVPAIAVPAEPAAAFAETPPAETPPVETPPVAEAPLPSLPKPDDRSATETETPAEKPVG